jgi:hypothetical protein
MIPAAKAGRRMNIVVWKREKRIVNCEFLGSIGSVVER